MQARAGERVRASVRAKVSGRGQTTVSKGHGSRAKARS